MSDFTENPHARLKRVYKESSALGLSVRFVARGLATFSYLLSKGADHLVTKPSADWYTSRKDRALLKDNEMLKGRHTGERCVIVATGPSIRNQNLTLLQGEYVFTINQAFRLPPQVTSQATYHFVVDPVFMEPEYSETLSEMICVLGTQKVNLIASLELKEHIEKSFEGNCLGGRIFPVKQMLISSYWDRGKDPISVNLAKVLPGFTSVVHLAISSALYMGFKEIVLVGVDMDYFLRPGQKFTHAYDKDLQADKTVAEVFQMDQIELMEWVLVEFRAFQKLNETAQQMGARIFNASDAGALEIFPRVQFEEVFGRE